MRGSGSLLDFFLSGHVCLAKTCLVRFLFNPFALEEIKCKTNTELFGKFGRMQAESRPPAAYRTAFDITSTVGVSTFFTPCVCPSARVGKSEEIGWVSSP